MIGVRVRFEKPIDCQPFAFRMGDHGVGGSGRRPARGGVEVEDAVDHGASPAHRIMDDIAHGIRRLVKKALDAYLSAGAGPHGVNLLDRQGQIWIPKWASPRDRFHTCINYVIIYTWICQGC